ncbi:MAG: hypothetical protein P4N59_29760 [Negativicutes bacterium]|nr:hypothetical protein [Negativicutes bacterium]
MAVIQWIIANEKTILRVMVVLLAAGILYFVWARLHPAKVVTFESQQQASTPTGVEGAANAAEVPISSAQAAEIASVIKHDAGKPPNAVVQTNGASLIDTAKKELQKFGGQFSIVTEPKNPAIIPALSLTGKTVTSAKGGTLSPNTPVTLNQYNIKAYPDRLIQVGGSYQELFAAYSWRVNVPKIPLIAPRGDIGYLGVYGHANLDNPGMSRIGIILTIPK